MPGTVGYLSLKLKDGGFIHKTAILEGVGITRFVGETLEGIVPFLQPLHAWAAAVQRVERRNAGGRPSKLVKAIASYIAIRLGNKAWLKTSTKRPAAFLTHMRGSGGRAAV